MARPISKRDAEALFAQLHELLVNTERVIIEIIERKAWAALGYPSFEAAWLDRMKGVRLATSAMKAHVVYSLLDTSTPEDVADAIRMHPGLVEVLARQKKNGVPAGRAIVRQRHRGKPSQPSCVTVQLTVAERAQFASQAMEAGSSLAELSAQMIREGFAAMGRKRRRRAA